MTTEMMEDFAQRCGVNLIVLHGNTKIKHTDFGTDRYLCFHQWDNHCYLVKNARPYVQKPVIDLDKPQDTQKICMDRDEKRQTEEWQPWGGEITPGFFV